jgi:hypothetical protein
VHENVNHLVSGIIEARASKQKLNYILAIDFLVVLEEYVQRDVGLDHVLRKLFNGRPGRRVELLNLI